MVLTQSPWPQGLAEAGYEIVSTGGSAKAIEAAGVAVKSVDQLTGFPEMLDGMPLRQDLHPCQASPGLIALECNNATLLRGKSAFTKLDLLGYPQVLTNWNTSPP